MPVQIDEVIITATVDPQTGSGSSGANAATPADPVEGEREWADRILQIIREKNER